MKTTYRTGIAAFLLSILTISTSTQTMNMPGTQLAQTYPKTTTFAATYLAWVAYNKWQERSIYSYPSIYWKPWDSSTIYNENPQGFYLPTGFSFVNQFLWGVGTSAHQVEGNLNDTFTRFGQDALDWEKIKDTFTDAKTIHDVDLKFVFVEPSDERKAIYNRLKNRYSFAVLKTLNRDDAGNKIIVEQAGVACDHCKNYATDIQLVYALRKQENKQDKRMAYRFSLARSKIETAPGVFNAAALDHYADVCTKLVQQGLTPVIGLHHYTDPNWMFNDGRKGFEDEASIDMFGQYAQKVADYLYENVFNNKQVNTKNIQPIWITFNSPGGYAARGYLTGAQYPAVKNMPRMSKVFSNLLRAHVSAYKKIKLLYPQAQVGITKNIQQFRPWTAWNPLESLAASSAYDLMDRAYYEFFTKGTFTVKVPFKVRYYAPVNVPEAPNSVDFFGLNYYSHRYFKTLKTLAYHPRDEITENKNYVMYPEGLYHAIADIHNKLLKPINKKRTGKKVYMYVTENGIGTPNTDDGNEQRTRFYQKYMFALAKAIKDGYNVRGYITWSLMDNYEWGTFDKHYGIYSVDRTNPTTLERRLKEGSRYWVNLINDDKDYCKNNFTKDGQPLVKQPTSKAQNLMPAKFKKKD